MLFEASFKDSKILVRKQIVELKRGQLQGSISYFVNRWNTNKDQVIDFLKLLQKEGMIDKSSDKNITIITICNYDSYQGCNANKSDSLSDNNPDSQSDNKSDTNKECIEDKEINNNISNAHTREEKPVWVGENERALLERFKAQGCSMAVARATGLKPAEINQLLDIFMAKCELSNKGHKDLEHFNNRFLWAIQNKKISLLKQEQPTQQKKVTTNQDIYRQMQEMGWQN